MMVQDPTHLSPLPKAMVASLIEVGHRLGQQGHVPATSGNFSCRVGDTQLALTASGGHKGRLTPDDILKATLQGQPLGAKTPSAETALHVQLYERFPAINAVLHTHAASAVALTLALSDEAKHLTLHGYELLKAFPAVTSHQATVTLPIVPNNQCMTELCQWVSEALTQYPAAPAYLIRGHGVYTWGVSVAEAERVHEALDALLKVEVTLRALKQP
jgi:methylthioribulose-1-phosphate dehydratase